jgi:hypothetical protein
MIRRRARGDAWQSIADELNSVGRLRRNGTPWTAPAVAKIVSRHASQNDQRPPRRPIVACE